MIAIFAQKLNFLRISMIQYHFFFQHFIYAYCFDRFDPVFHQTTNLRHNIARRNTRTKKKKKSGKKKTSSRSTATKGRRRQRRRSSTRGRDRKQSDPVPRPKLPRPTLWSPKRRYLADEPIPKVIRHS